MNTSPPSSNNPILPALLRVFNWTEAMLLLIAGSVFFLPDLVRPHWPWVIAPFNAGFVGAVYLGSFTATALMVLHNRWAPARIVLPMIFVFTTIVLGIILFNLDKFDFQNPVTFVWILFYIALPINSAYHLWLLRDLAPANAHPTNERWRYFLFAFAALLGLYGLTLIVAPVAASAFWPWPIDAFHGQMYSGAFITMAVGSYLIARKAASVEWQTLGLTLIVIAATSIVGLVWVNATVPLDKKVNWALSGTWAWLILIAVIGATGVAMFSHSRQIKNP
ncbi:MAG: hypothetical protein H7Y59_15195 [Anaerolineales bacterium]|nr:hypothetical protein [Anaerolineales bacterium]